MPANLLQSAFSGGEISPALYGRIDFYKYSISAKKLRNFIVRPFGGISNRGGLKLIGEIKNGKGARLIPFSYSLNEQYILELGEYYMRFWQLNDDGSLGLVLKNGAIYEEVMPYSEKDLETLTYTQLGNVMYFAHRDYPPKRLERFAADIWTLSDLKLNPQIQAPQLNSILLIGDHSNTNSITYKWDYCITAVDKNGEESIMSNALSVNGHPELNTARYVRLTFGLTSFPSGVIDNLNFKSIAYVYINNINTCSEIIHTREEFIQLFNSKVSNITASLHGSNGVKFTATNETAPNGTTIQIQITALHSSAQWYSVVLSGGTTQTDNSIEKYNIYRYTAGVYSWIAETKDSVFDDTGYQAYSEQNPPKLFTFFQSKNNYPGTVAVFQQRLCFAGTYNDPARIWLSRIAQYENFSVDDNLHDSSAIDVKIFSGRSITDIQHLIAGRDLTILARDSEWCLSGASGVSPLDLELTFQNRRGANKVCPIAVDNYIVYVGADGKSLRDLSYSLDANGYIGNDLTLLAKHFFDGFSLKSIGFQQNPNSLLWAIRNDGKLLGLTYLKEQDIFAWTLHETEGTFKDLIVIDTENKDRVFCIIQRENNFYLEEMQSPISTNETLSDAFYVDCGLSNTFSEEVTSVSGLEHLANKEVSLLIDGHAYLHQKVEADGVLKLPEKAKSITVGLPYQSFFQSLDMQTQLNNGTSFGRRRSISKIIIYFERSRGLLYGTDENNLFEAKERSSEKYNEPIQLYSGFKELHVAAGYDKEVNLFIKSIYPLPLNIMNFVEEVDFGN